VLNVGGNSKRITTTPNKNEFSPMWAPDGETVVYMETDEVEYSAIVRRAADGSHRREIDRSTADYLLYPSVSPNGRRVLYSRSRGAAPMARGVGGYDLVTKRLDGTGGRRWLTTDDRLQIAGDWSPDGKRVVFLERPVGTKELGAGASTNVHLSVFRGPATELLRADGPLDEGDRRRPATDHRPDGHRGAGPVHTGGRAGDVHSFRARFRRHLLDADRRRRPEAAHRDVRDVQRVRSLPDPAELRV